MLNQKHAINILYTRMYKTEYLDTEKLREFSLEVEMFPLCIGFAINVVCD